MKWDPSSLRRVARSLDLVELVETWLLDWRSLWQNHPSYRPQIRRVLVAKEDAQARGLAAVAEKASIRGASYATRFALEDLDAAIAAPPPKAEAKPNSAQRSHHRTDCPHNCEDGWLYGEDCAAPCPYCLPDMDERVRTYLRRQHEADGRVVLIRQVMQ